MYTCAVTIDYIAHTVPRTVQREFFVGAIFRGIYIFVGAPVVQTTPLTLHYDERNLVRISVKFRCYLFVSKKREYLHPTKISSIL